MIYLNKFVKFFLYSLILSTFVLGQDDFGDELENTQGNAGPITVTGVVTDANTGKPLAGANITVDNTDLGAADLTNANLHNTKIQNSYFKNAKINDVIIDNTDTDICFEQDFLSKVVCKIKLEINPNSPPYESYFKSFY